MKIINDIIKGASSQFGREFGRAAANSILKGKNYYTVKTTNASCIEGVDPKKVISFSIVDDTYKDEEQYKFLHVKNQKIVNQWLYCGWFFLFIPYIFTLISYIRSYKYYDNLLKNNQSLATVWFNVKIADGRKKEGFYYRKELLLSNNHTRPLFEDEIIFYEKLRKSNKIKAIISGILILPLLYLIISILSI